MTPPVVSTPGDRLTIYLGGIQARPLISEHDHPGVGFCVIEAPIGPRTLAGPLHTHRHEDGCWYVVEGRFAAQVGDEVVSGGPGSLILAPRGVPHTYWNPGDEPALYLEMCWPGGLDKYMRSLGDLLAHPGENVLEDVARMSEEFGIEMDWASLDGLMSRHGVELLTG